MSDIGHDLQNIVESSNDLKQVRRCELQFGDLLLVTTKNSLYSINIIGRDFFLICGGWFDRKSLSPARMTIAGCTWGGSIIKVDILAACGLRLEFGNGVVTTAIQEWSVIRSGSVN